MPLGAIFFRAGTAGSDDAEPHRRGLDRILAALTSACGAEMAAAALEGGDAHCAGDDDDAPSAAPEILDLDACLALLARRGNARPDTVEERVALHLGYLEELAASLKRAASDTLRQ